MGYYNLYNGASFLGERAFAFTIADGAYDLGDQVDGGLGSNDWAFLARAFRESDGTVFGYGAIEGMTSSTVGYALKVVPEASTVALTALAGAIAICSLLVLRLPLRRAWALPNEETGIALGGRFERT